LSVKRQDSLLLVWNEKLAYRPSCIRPEVTLPLVRRILCDDCCEKMCYG